MDVSKGARYLMIVILKNWMTEEVSDIPAGEDVSTLLTSLMTKLSFVWGNSQTSEAETKKSVHSA